MSYLLFWTIFAIILVIVMIAILIRLSIYLIFEEKRRWLYWDNEELKMLTWDELLYKKKLTKKKKYETKQNRNLLSCKQINQRVK